MRDFHWLNASLLPLGSQTARKDGLYAELHDDGQLLHFGFYEGGSCDESWALDLPHRQAAGKAILRNGSGGTPDLEVYADGSAERFDAWSDNSPAVKVAFKTWVAGWIAKIAEAAARRESALRAAADTRAAVAKVGRRGVLKVVK